VDLRRASTVVGCGCAVVIAVFLAGALTLTWGTYRAGKDFAEVARDPVAAAERAREVVGFGELPAGYRPSGALSVPLLLDVAFFLAPMEEDSAGEDGAVEIGGDGAGGGAAAAVGAGEDEPLRVDRGFLYVRLRDWMGRGDELQEELLGSGGDEAPLAQEGLDFDPDEVVGRGELTAGGAQVAWLARRGKITIDPEGFGRGGAKVVVDDEALTEVDYSGGGGGAGGPAAPSGPVPGVLSVLALDCPGDDSWHRIGVWFAPDPAPELPAAEVDWSGGPGDPAAIADFLGRFELCG
jgi:hypothetical protein